MYSIYEKKTNFSYLICILSPMMAIFSSCREIIPCKLKHLNLGLLGGKKDMMTICFDYSEDATMKKS